LEQQLQEMQEILNAALSQKSSTTAKPMTRDEVISPRRNFKAYTNEDKSKTDLTSLEKKECHPTKLYHQGSNGKILRVI
jgi:hypothetical protein